MIHIYQGEDITRRQFQTKDGTAYPSNWISLSTAPERAAIGIQDLVEIWPSLTSTQDYLGWTDDFVALTRTYGIREKTEAEIAAALLMI